MKTKWRRARGFGLYADLVVPLGTDAIVLCVSGGAQTQLKPVEVCLPHQVYLKKAHRLLKEHNATELVAIPYVRKDWVRVTLPKGGK